MLLNNLFVFTQQQLEGNILRTDVELDFLHPIFAGHFPGQPILPGVCMMQMVKEAIETYIGKKINLVKALDMKFLTFLDPRLSQDLQLDIKLNPVEDNYTIDAKLLDGDTVFFKMKAVFKTA